MPAEAVANGCRSLADPLPALVPVVVAAEDVVAPMLHASRAQLAALTARLSALTEEARQAEEATGEVDLADARTLLEMSLREHLGKRRSAHEARVEAARIDAAKLIAGAQEVAASIIADANEAVLAVLLTGTERSPAPTLRVVDSTGLHNQVAGAGGDDEPTSPPTSDEMLDETPAAFAVEPALAEAPAPRGASTDGAATLPTMYYTVGPDGRQLVALPLPLAPAPPAPSLPFRPVDGTGAPAVGTGDGTASHLAKRNGVSRYLYVDVILPAIGVLIVLILLLAWVG